MDLAVVSLLIVAWLWPVPLACLLLASTLRFLTPLHAAAGWVAKTSIATALVLLAALLVVMLSPRTPSAAANIPLWLALFVVAPLVGSGLVLARSPKNSGRPTSTAE